MPTMSDLLRFDGALKRQPAIDTWLRTRSEALRPFAQAWFERMRQCGDDVVELMHDGCPTVCVGDAGFAYVNVYRDHVNVGFFRGAQLPDPAKLLEGTGKLGRHVKLRPGSPVNEAALGRLIHAAYVDIKERDRTTS